MKRVGKHDEKRPNPQGKGVVPILRDWQSLRPLEVAGRTPERFLRDYCISSLILGASFKFKPVVGKRYFLYARQTKWTLSLVSPTEWGHKVPGEFLSACFLRPDMTWELDSSELSASPALPKLQNYIEHFVDFLKSTESVAATLPFYVGNLPYYQRMLATALASSLSHSSLSTQDMQALLHDSKPLIEVLSSQQ